MNKMKPPEMLAKGQPVQCPVCNARLCDIIPSKAKVRVLRQGGLLRLKCRKCGREVGITVETEKSRAI